MVRRKTGSYPISTADGTQAYFDTASSTTDTSLSCGTIYYYRAWAYDSDSTYYSDSYSQDTETTVFCSTLTTWSFQRKTFYDSADNVFWRFSYDGTEIDIEYNAQPWTSAWTATTSMAVNTADFSVWDDNTYVYIAYYSTNDIRVNRGTLNASSITWGSETVALDGTGVSANYELANITQDSAGRLWVIGRYYNGTNYYLRARKSQNPNDHSSWAVSTYDLSDTSNTAANTYGVINSIGSQDMYCTWYKGTAIEGKKWTNGSSAWDVLATSLGTGSSGFDNNISISSDTSNNLHLGAAVGNSIYYRKYTVGSGWDASATTLDGSGTNRYVSVSVDTSNNDVYVLYLDTAASTVYYLKYSGGWGAVTNTGWTEGTSPTSLTSNYADSGKIFAEWNSQAAAPYTLNWNYIIIPEKIWLFLGLGLLIPKLLKKQRRKKEFDPICSEEEVDDRTDNHDRMKKRQV